MTSPKQVSHIFSAGKIRIYVYEMLHKHPLTNQWITVKYGLSADNAKNWGDRLYSQLGHLNSWEVRLNRGGGAEFKNVMERFKLAYDADMDHRNMFLNVWDLTNYSFVQEEPTVEVRQFESELLRRYSNTFDRLPVGNISYDSKILTRSLIDKKHPFLEWN